MPFPFCPDHAAKLSTEEHEILVQLLESQGYRELAAAHIFGAGLHLAPTLDDKMLLAEQAREELEHFEAVAELRALLGPGDLLEAVRERVSEVPMPTSWLELAVVRFLFDRAGRFQLREYRASRFGPYAEMVEKILAEEEGHEAAGAAILRDLCRSGTAERAEVQALFERWLRISLLSFGRPDSLRGRRAVKLGLKARDSAEVIRDYVRDLGPTLSACGLSLPSGETLGLDLPDGGR